MLVAGGRTGLPASAFVKYQLCTASTLRRLKGLQFNSVQGDVYFSTTSSLKFGADRGVGKVRRDRQRAAKGAKNPVIQRVDRVHLKRARNVRSGVSDRHAMDDLADRFRCDGICPHFGT